MKARAYLTVCKSLREEGVLRDPVIFFLFSEGDMRHFLEDLESEYVCLSVNDLSSKVTTGNFVAYNGAQDIYRVMRILDRNSLVDHASEVMRLASALVLLLDVELVCREEKSLVNIKIQDQDSLADVWFQIDKRDSDDLIGLVTTEHYNVEMAARFPVKGYGNLPEVSGNENSRFKKAKDVIIEAKTEWERRYAYRGGRLVHALILAQQFGPKGHIHNFSTLKGFDGNNDFPFFSILDCDGRIKTFKSLFFYAEAKSKKYNCPVSTVASLLQACGVTCPINQVGDIKHTLFPITPGALYLFYIVHIVNLLGEETHDNPVTHIEVGVDQCGFLLVRAMFTRDIDNLIACYRNNVDGGTVNVLKQLTSENPTSPYHLLDPSIASALNEAERLTPVLRTVDIDAVRNSSLWLVDRPVLLSGNGRSITIAINP